MTSSAPYMSSTSSSMVTPLDSVSSSVVGVAPELISTAGLLVDGADDVVLGVDDDSEVVVLDSVDSEDVDLEDVVGAAPAASDPPCTKRRADSPGWRNHEH
jgi:hypothetical protein